MANQKINSFIFFSTITIILFDFSNSIDTTISPAYDIESKNLPVVSEKCTQQNEIFALLNKPTSFGKEVRRNYKK